MAKVPTSAKDYKNKRRRIIDTPGGDVFEIKKMTPTIYGMALSKIGIGPEHFDEQGQLINPEKARVIISTNIIDVMKYVIPKCVVSPKIIIDEYEETDENLLFDDIDDVDLTKIVNEIYDLSGISTAAEEERKEFLEDEVSEADP